MHMIHQLQYTLLNWTSYAFNPKPLRLITHKNSKGTQSQVPFNSVKSESQKTQINNKKLP